MAYIPKCTSTPVHHQNNQVVLTQSSLRVSMKRGLRMYKIKKYCSNNVLASYESSNYIYQQLHPTKVSCCHKLTKQNVLSKFWSTPTALLGYNPGMLALHDKHTRVKFLVNFIMRQQSGNPCFSWANQ